MFCIVAYYFWKLKMKINNVNLLNYTCAKNSAKPAVYAKYDQNNMVSFSKEA